MLSWKGERMRKITSKICTVLLLLLFLIGNSTVTAEASNYPEVIFFEDAEFNHVAVALTSTVGDVVQIRMLWYSVYINEGYDLAIKDSNGSIVGTANSSWTNLQNTKYITINWDTKQASAGRYTVEVTKNFYSFLRWNSAPTVSRLWITLNEKPHEHTVVIDPAVSATCKSEGKTQGSHCSVCGQVIQPQVSTPITDHSITKWKITKKATVLKTGKKTGKCSVCKKKVNRTIEKLPATIKVRQSVTVKAKKTTKIKVTYNKGDGIKSWKTRDKHIATVTKNGKVAGKKKGTTVLTVKLKSGKTANVVVIVK